MAVRLPVVAGMFYPAERERLKGVVEGYLESAREVKPEGKLKVLIVPHAGYEYSGSVAAAGFRALVRRFGGQKKPATIVLLGVSHSEWFPGIAVYNPGAWETPLGQVKVDEGLARKLIDSNFQIVADSQAHRHEHSLEVQLPFLQSTLKNFEIVPLLIGQAQEKSLVRLAELIALTFRVKNSQPERLLLLVSSDLSHYPDYETAKMVDEKTVEAIKAGDWQKFEQTLDRLRNDFPQVDTFACGAEAIKVGLIVAEKLKAKRAVVFEQKNSGDPAIRRAGIPGDKNRVVGYASIGFYG